MVKRDFTEWLATFRKSIAPWDYYTDFNKIYANVEQIKVELNILNSLIGSKTIEKDFINLANKYPEILRVIPILLAVRNYEILIYDADKDFLYEYNFYNQNYSLNEYSTFMKNTGLFDLLQNHIIKDLSDYVKGIEVGMDTNARKNRTGHLMEDLVESFIVKAGFLKYYTYFKEMKKSDIEGLFDVNLDSISNNGKTEKRFDFVVKAKDCVYAIETNFYSGGGSKLNETARSYELIAREAKDIPGFKFIWITDGIGWISARRNLEQTFDFLENLYNINDLQEGKLKEVLK
jgi:type II restriction enzyme